MQCFPHLLPLSFDRLPLPQMLCILTTHTHTQNAHCNIKNGNKISKLFQNNFANATAQYWRLIHDKKKKKEYLNVKWFDVDVDKLLFYGRCWVSNWLSAKPSIVPCGHMMRNKATFIYSLYFDAKGQFEGYINWSIYKMIQINGQWSMLRSNERIKNDRVDNNPSSIKCSKTSLTTNIELNRVL